MATTQDFINYVLEQIFEAGDMTYKKMFGEYMVYCNLKPVLLVCDNTVFVKQLPAVAELFKEYGKISDTAIPYNGAKPHYILDIEDGDFAIDMVKLLYKILPPPKPKKAIMK